MYKNGLFTIRRAADLATQAMRDAVADPTSGTRPKIRTIKECMWSLTIHRNQQEFNNVMSHIDAAFNSLRMLGYLASDSDRERKLIKLRKVSN